jgi:hypothetical protein
MKKIKNYKKPRQQQKLAQWLCKICSMCENMISCVKMWLVLNICVKYAKCVKICPSVWKIDFHWYLCQCFKIWSFVWKFYFHWIFLWNMLNVWKYRCLWSVCSFLKSCVQFLVKCVLSIEAKGRHAYRTRVSHLSKGRRAYRTRVLHLSKGRNTLWRRVSLLLNMHTKKEIPTDCSPWECSLRQHVECPLAWICQTYLCQRSPSGLMQEAPHRAQAIWNLRSKWPTVGLKASEHCLY